MADILQILLPLATGLFSWFGAHTAMKTHMEYLRRDVDFANKAIADHIKQPVH